MPTPLQPQTQIKPEQIFDIIVRRRWLIVIPLCISLSLGLVKTLTANKTYQASTLILVQQQSVPSEYVRSVVTSSINQRINTISQQILSRSNLEKIIDQFGLYENRVSMYLEDKVADMRRRIHVKIERARHGAEAFSISFKGSDPRRVMQIANTLASFFMDENLKVREAQAIGTSEFLESELEKTKRRLEERERRLSEYRSKYLGGLPDELETNLRTLDRFQEQLNSKNDRLRESRTELKLLEAQMSALERSVSKPAAADEGEALAEPGFRTETQEKLAQAQKALDEMLVTYTRKHPDVIKLEKLIHNLKTKVTDEASRSRETGPEDASGPVRAESEQDQAQARLAVSKIQLVAEINQIKSEIREIEAQMKVYQTRVEETPKRELEMQSLKRDYNNIRDVFNSLLDRKLEAELSVNMEKKQKGEQFRILDHARLPEKPISPDVKKLFLLFLAAGLGIGGGIIFLLEFFDSAIRRDEQIEEELGLTILASIPPLKMPGDRKKWQLELALFVVLSLYAATLLSFFAVLNIKGLDRTINLIKLYLPV